ncbi:MAG: hypothetical protein IKI55_02175, partial [Bacilli bacterium]|nr:hypothetical protein [Bacilli bacterium]
FTVSLYDASNTNKVASFNAEYGKTITFERSVTADVTTIVVKLDGVTKHTYENLTTDATKICYNLDGTYKNEADSVNLHSASIENTNMSFTITYGEGAEDHTPKGGSAKLQGNVRIHPVVKDA